MSVENLSPANGLYLGPMWAGFHDGTFDLYNTSQMIDNTFAPLVEDANPSQLLTLFMSENDNFKQGVISGLDGTAIPPVIDPGETAFVNIDVDTSSPATRFFSYMAKIAPSNDAFIGNEQPTQYPVFNGSGTFTPVTIMVTGQQVLDAGVEVNDELPQNTYFFGQTGAGNGQPQDGFVQTHPGFIGSVANPGVKQILADSRFVNADFKVGGFNVAKIKIELASGACPADLNGDGLVNSSDLGLLLGAWGSNSGAADINHDGVVNSTDLSLLLGGWGLCQ